MAEATALLTAALTGFVSGLLVSFPIGPVNLTIINEGARRGFAWAALIGLGATSMEVIYCAVAFTGFAAIFSRGYVEAAMQLLSFVFMLYLGMRFLLAKRVPPPSRLETRLEARLHPHSAFLTGLVRVMGNPGVLLGWIVLAANFISRGWVAPHGPAKLACVAGVALGTGLWFLGLSYAVSLGHKKFTATTLLRMERLSGLGLLALALAHGVRIIWQMAHHRL